MRLTSRDGLVDELRCDESRRTGDETVHVRLLKRRRAAWPKAHRDLGRLKVLASQEETKIRVGMVGGTCRTILAIALPLRLVLEDPTVIVPFFQLPAGVLVHDDGTARVQLQRGGSDHARDRAFH